MSCRKNYRDLSVVERDRFVQALHHVKATGVVDQFASDHDTFFHAAHHSSHFLPWHREFVRRFEDALRTYHPDVRIPYWDSTVDTSASDPLWDHAFLGQFDAAWGLDRVLEAATLPTPEAVQETLALTTYGDFWDPLEWDIHNPPHNWVGGVMATGASPGDPVFYLHHCWIDLLWAQWQLLHPGAPFDSSGAGAGLNDPMAPWPTTPADVLDHRTINLYDYPAGFQQDLPEVSLATSTVNFVDVPEGETRMAAAVFDLQGCGTVQLTVVAGPTVTSGPAGTAFVVHASPVVAHPSADPHGRVWLRFTGTDAGDIAAGTVTIRCEETGVDHPVAITANTIARPTAAVMLTLDRSNSMTFDSGIAPGVERQDVLKFSAPTVIDVVEDVHAIGVCSFDHDAHLDIGVTPVIGGGRVLINGTIAGYAPNPNGWTSIGEGLALAHDTLDPVGGYEVKATVVLTDGQENHGGHTRRYITDVADMIDEHVFAIGLGRPEVLNPVALQALCNGTQGYMLITGDLDSEAYFRVAKYYQQILAGVTSHDVVLDPEGWLHPGQEHRIPFWLNETDISARAVLLTPAPHAVSMALETPDGDIIDPGVAAGHPMATFGAGTGVAFYRVGLPIPLGAGSAQAGRWHTLLRVDEREYKRHVSSLDNHPTFFRQAAAHGIRYSATVQAYSNLRMHATLTQTSNEPGATLDLRAVLTEYGVPVTGAACRAELTHPDGTGTVQHLSESEPGVFGLPNVATAPGVYRFRVMAGGRTMRGRPFTREQLLTGAVWAGGDRPPPSSQDDPGRRDERFCQLVACLLEERSVRALFERAGVGIDEVRRCIERFCRKPSPPGPTGGRRRHDLAEALRPVLRDEPLVQTVLDEVERRDCFGHAK